MSKAALVGAKTVNGPGLARVSARPAALTAARRVENLLNDTGGFTGCQGYLASEATRSVMVLSGVKG